MNKQILKPLTLAIAAIAVGGCGSSSSTSDGDDGTLSLGLTDAPTSEFSEVNITFTGVSLQPADGERVSFEFDSAKSLNLLDLQGGETESFLNNESVPAGDYEWMRLNIVADNISVKNAETGETKSVFVPSGAQRGVQTSGFTVSAEGNRDFTIDFDVKKSIIDRGGNQAQKEGIQAGPEKTNADFILRPTLRLVDNLDVGSISGSVDVSTLQQTANESCKNGFDGAVYVHKGADATVGDFGSSSEPLVAAPVTTDDNNNTVYKAAFLEEATYKVSYVCQADDNDVDSDVTEFINTAEVQVTAGEETTHNFDETN